jgi:hypothetical protein
MGKEQKSILALAIIAAFVVTALFVPGLIVAGDLDPPDTAVDPTTGDPVATEPTLDDIYQQVTKNCGPSIIEGIPKTGQTTSHGTGDDGDLEKGVAWPIPRFTDNEDGTVTDNLTGLIWLKNANCFGEIQWASALTACNSLASGSCGLDDGSVAGDWRLPNILELASLIHYGVSGYIPLSDTWGTGEWSEGDPFFGVQFDGYWSSTNDNAPQAYKRIVWFDTGGGLDGKYSFDTLYVWPVRGGQ